MRIVQALGSGRRGGTERFFIRLAIALQERDVHQQVLARGRSWAASQLEAGGVSCRHARFLGKLDFPSRMAFRAVLREGPAPLALTWLRNAAEACPRGPWMRVARIGRRQPLAPFGGFDHLIVNSPLIVEDVKAQGWAADRVSFIPNFVPDFTAERTPRGCFNTPEDVPLIVWLGRLEWEKGPDLALRALAEVPTAHLWMAGAGSYECAARRMAAELGISTRVRFLGWRDDIHALLAAADIFLRTSRDESLGNVIEAWAHGLPVVSAHFPGSDRMIANGETGLLAAAGDPTASALAIKSLIANGSLAAGLGAAGREHFQVTYSKDSVVDMYLDLFRRLQEKHVARLRLATAVQNRQGHAPFPTH